jgi:hypothetical protein
MFEPKPRRLAAFAVAVALSTFAFLTAAHAAEEMRTGGPPAEYTQYLKMKPMELMHMMDPDKKGFVTKEEFTKFHEEFFDKLDKDHDGKVTQEEWMAHHAAKSEKAKSENK